MAHTELKASEVPREVRLLADALSQRHGMITVSRESGGLHIYMASPICLERTGEVELTKRHLAINVDRCLGIGAFRNRKGTYNADWSALCMKTDIPYKVTDLLKMPPLDKRGLEGIKPEVSFRARDRHTITDALGVQVPYGPGVCTPLTELEPDHPAITFLEGRGYSPVGLYMYMRASFCEVEIEEDAVCGRWYKRMPQGWKDTPQGRIIFFGDMEGSQQIWQARILEQVVDRWKFFWHPYRREWVSVMHRAGGERP